jgi:hypothetical protein
MSHRFKRLKPLGKSRKNMRSENGESPKLSPAVLESAEIAGIYDFLYVDRARISALYAQLFPQGILTGVKTTAQQSFSADQNIGTDIKLLKADTKSTEGGSEGIEHMFDASWSIPLEVLECLRSRSLVRQSLQGAGLGCIILTDCYLRVIEFASMDNLWEPAMHIFVESAQPPQPISPEAISTISQILKAMPRAIHAHYLTRDAALWSSLQPENLTIPTADLTLKYGGTISGSWKLLYLLDAWPDAGDPPDLSGVWSAGEMMNGILTAVHSLRGAIGRPAGWVGITPLMIFRDIAGWLPPAV